MKWDRLEVLASGVRVLDLLEEACGTLNHVHGSDNHLYLRLDSIDFRVHFISKSDLDLAKGKLCSLMGRNVGILRVEDSRSPIRIRIIAKDTVQRVRVG